MTTFQTPTTPPSTVPRAPTGVTASIDLSTKITVAWEAVAGATGYTLYRGTTDDPASSSVLASGLSGTSYDDTTAAAEGFYFYWLKVTTAGGTSGYSGMASGWRFNAAPASAPTGVNATNNVVGEVDVSWSAATGALFYDVYRNTTNTSSGATRLGSSATTTFVDDNATYGTTYYYFVKAGNYSGYSGFSSSHSGVALPPIPAAPANPTASTGIVGHIDVSADTSTYATSYSVYRSTVNNSAGATLLASGLGSPAYTDSSITPGTVYYYWWKATNGTGTSGFSASASGSSLAAPAPPASVTATDGTVFRKVTVTWAASSGATSYSVWRGTTSSSGAASQLASGLAGTTYDDTSLTDTNIYYYWVKATNGAGTSAFAPTGTTETGSAAAPTQPPQPSATSGDPNKITVSFAASTGADAGVDTMKIYRGITSVFADAGLLVSGLTPPAYGYTTTYDDDLPDLDTTYYYWIVSHNTVGDSPPSAYATGISPTPDLPAAPTVWRQADGYGAWWIEWYAVSGAVDYEIAQANIADPTDPGFATQSFYTTGLSYFWDGGYYYTPGYFYVRARNRAGNGPWTYAGITYP